VGWLFEDIKQSTRAIDSIALRIAYPFDNTRAFQPFDCALCRGECDRQSLSDPFRSDERICSQEFDYAQRIVG
jgi:hypothetical protein